MPPESGARGSHSAPLLALILAKDRQFRKAIRGKEGRLITTLPKSSRDSRQAHLQARKTPERSIAARRFQSCRRMNAIALGVGPRLALSHTRFDSSSNECRHERLVARVSELFPHAAPESGANTYNGRPFLLPLRGQGYDRGPHGRHDAYSHERRPREALVHRR